MAENHYLAGIFHIMWRQSIGKPSYLMLIFAMIMISYMGSRSAELSLVPRSSPE